MKTRQRAEEALIRLYEGYAQLESRKYLCEEIEALTLIEIKTILVIGRSQGQMKMSTIASELGVTSGTPTVTVDRLIKKGYVNRLRDDLDRRLVYVELSELGQKSYSAVVKAKNDIMDRIFGLVSSDELALMANVLERIESNLNLQAQK